MTTIGELVRRIIPVGTALTPEPHAAFPDQFQNFPFWPPDVFAITALLVERSAAYRRLADPPKVNGDRSDHFGVLSVEWREAMKMRAKAWAWGLAVPDETSARASVEAMTAANIDDLDAIIAADLAPIAADWRSLIVHAASPVACADDDAPIPAWWAPAVRLLITADQACAGAGFHRPGGHKLNWVQRTILGYVNDPSDGDETTERSSAPFLSTIASDRINPSICAVLPKTRTPSVGCTLRSMTHNLALLPPISQVEARWALPGKRPPAARTRPGESAQPLNLLLVPFPYWVRAADFKAVGGADHAALGETGSGFYAIEQTWLSNSARDKPLAAFAAFVRDLVEGAKSELGSVHGVIFPELALNPEFFNAVAEELKNDAATTGFEFIVAGCSGYPAADVGDDETKGSERNVVLFKAWDKTDRRWGIFGGRDKHHRWKLNGPQIKRYGLSAHLPVAVRREVTNRKPLDWWESIPLARRVVGFFEVRAGTSMTLLICEDLARADPCQQVVRAIGPNLVIALLFDGPQLSQRWPGHYAGVLADDPGSSVLTLTSLGLIERAATGDHTHSRSVALFRDCQGDERLIQLPPGSHAIALRLEADVVEEQSLDGRGDGENAYLWRLSELVPISAANGTPNWILGS